MIPKLVHLKLELVGRGTIIVAVVAICWTGLTVLAAVSPDTANTLLTMFPWTKLPALSPAG